jgi:hypothetical protein
MLKVGQTGQAEAASGTGVEAGAVVPDLERKPPVGPGQSDPHLPRAGVLTTLVSASERTYQAVASTCCG